MPEAKKCSICGKHFTPGIRHPEQTACPSPECQHKRQLENMKKWREKKAASSDSGPWKASCRRSSAEWRKKHQTYLKLYREEHKEEHNEYMREYMKNYRSGKKNEKI